MFLTYLGQKAHDQEVVGSKPAAEVMDVSEASYYLENSQTEQNKKKY